LQGPQFPQQATQSIEQGNRQHIASDEARAGAKHFPCRISQRHPFKQKPELQIQ